MRVISWRNPTEGSALALYTTIDMPTEEGRDCDPPDPPDLPSQVNGPNPAGQTTSCSPALTRQHPSTSVQLWTRKRPARQGEKADMHMNNEHSPEWEWDHPPRGMHSGSGPGPAPLTCVAPTSSRTFQDSQSPDIIVKQAAVANPQATYGAGSGTENNDALSDDVDTGHEPEFRLRATARPRRRRGHGECLGERICWTPPSTLVTPSMWNAIGSVTVPSVPGGNVLGAVAQTRSPGQRPRRRELEALSGHSDLAAGIGWPTSRPCGRTERPSIGSSQAAT